MKSRRWTCLRLVSLFVICMASRSQAQSGLEENKRQILEGLPRPEAVNVEDLFKKADKHDLKSELAKLKDAGITQETIQNWLKNPGFLEKIRNLNPDDPTLPPQMKSMLQGFSKEQIKNALSEERLRELQKQLKNSDQSHGTPPANGPNGSGGTNNLAPQNPSAGQGKNKEEPAIQNPPGQNPIAAGNQEPPEALDPDAPPPNTALSRGVMNWARSMQRLDPSLTDSPALRKAIRDLSRHVGENDPRWQKLTENAAAMKERLSKFSEALHLERLAPRNGIPWPQHWRRPSLPNWNRWHSDTESALTQSPARKLISTASSSSKGWQGLLAGVVLGLIGVIVWSVVFRDSREGATEEDRIKLGPWPLHPAAVANREDLVRAFEYLSLLWLGSAARTLNHETIAEQMGQKFKPAGMAALLWDPVAQQHAAFELAALYEQARYAPAAESLSDEALRAARRDLSFLAGMPAS